MGSVVGLYSNGVSCGPFQKSDNYVHGEYDDMIFKSHRFPASFSRREEIHRGEDPRQARMPGFSHNGDVYQPILVLLQVRKKRTLRSV